MHHLVASKPFPVQFLQLFEALAIVESRQTGCFPHPIEHKLYTKAAAKANPEHRFGSHAETEKSADISTATAGGWFHSG
jgi:hypothetical protein